MELIQRPSFDIGHERRLIGRSRTLQNEIAFSRGFSFILRACRYTCVLVLKPLQRVRPAVRAALVWRGRMQPLR